MQKEIDIEIKKEATKLTHEVKNVKETIINSTKKLFEDIAAILDEENEDNQLPSSIDETWIS